MNALSELSSDHTTPLLAPEILECFDGFSEGRCSLSDFIHSLLEACKSDPSAAPGVAQLLEDYGSTGRLKKYDFRPLQRELLRHSQPGLPPPHQLHAVDSPQAGPAPDDATTDPTGDVVTVAPVDEPVVDDPIDESAGSDPAADAPGPTNVLRGRYVLQEEIGRGGVGTVYRALDRNRAGLPHEQQCVALKVLRDEHARRPEALLALRREFHQAQSLSHPGIVNVFDFDQDEGTHFFTMELLDGESLKALMRRVRPHTLAREAAIRILRQLGDAIAYAHAHDVLHLDLKPGNVMVAPRGQVRILDFGLAQTYMAEPWISDSTPVPPAATPAYASCERLAGDLPDARDDIFSFACLGYELLSGQHPFDRRSALVARGEGRKPRRIRGLSRHQWRALKSGLAWARKDRPGSMQELLDALVPHGSTAPANVRMRPVRSVTRWRPVVVLSLLVFGVAAALGWNRLPDEFRADVDVRATATGEAFTHTADAVRAWATDQWTNWADEAKPVSASPTPRPAAIQPRTESASAVAPPSPQADVPTVETTAPTVAATLEPPAPLIADPAPAGTALPVVAPPTGGGPGTLEFTADTFTVSEADSMARLTVRRRGGSAGEISFEWHTADDSAIAGEDYASGTVREVMAAGQTTATLLIPIVSDAVAEHTELLDVVIDESRGARLGSVTHVPVIIVDDD